jgi:hypothetical protein
MTDDLVINGVFSSILNGSPDRTEWGPMIKVSIGDPAWDQKTIPKIVMADVAALLDTGAGICFIKNRIAISLSLPKIKDGTSINFDKVEKATLYSMVLVIPGFRKITSLQVVGKDLPESGFDVILGWSFLSRYTLLFSKKTDIVRLEWVGE